MSKKKHRQRFWTLSKIFNTFSDAVPDSDFFLQDLTVAETFYHSTNLDRPGDFFEALNSRRE